MRIIKLKKYNLIRKQLEKWNVKYHKLKMGKPLYNLLVDDKMLNPIYDFNLQRIKKVITV